MALKWYQLHSIPGKPWCEQHGCSPGYHCAWCWICVSAFLSPSFRTVSLVSEQTMGISGCAWWTPHGGPSSALLSFGHDFWDCFLTWPGMQWELFNLNENAETFTSQKEAKLPWGTRCDSWWSSLGFIRGQVCPVWPPRSQPLWHGLMAEVKCTSPTWPSISTELCCQWHERETVGRAAGGKQSLTFHLAMKEEQTKRDDEVACSASWKGTSFSIIHVCFVQSIRSPRTHSPISHLCQHRSA